MNYGNKHALNGRNVEILKGIKRIKTNKDGDKISEILDRYFCSTSHQSMT